MNTLLFDGNNLAMRSIHAMARSGLSADGVHTGPLYVFINSLTRHIREEDPDSVVVCWDSGVSDFRTQIDPGYKAHRKQATPEQDAEKRSHFGLMKEFLSLANIHQVERPGFEADDLIAYYAAEQRKARRYTVILSSDHDFLQLLDDMTSQVRFSSSDTPTDRWTAERVEGEHGCTPEQFGLAMALAGDPGDGVPGVPGFGMKTALKHLRVADFDLDSIEHPKVLEHREQIDRARLLTDLRTPHASIELPPLPEFHPTRPGDALYEEYIRFLTRYRMQKIKDRVFNHTLWKEESHV